MTGQLGADEAAEPLASLFDELGDDDWLSSELPKVFAMIGPATIPALAKALENDGIKTWSRISIPSCFQEIAQQHPDSREDCVGVLTHVLGKYAANDPALNGFVILGLTDLGALEAIDLIRAAYAMECVDLSVLGDIEDVEIEMGIRDRRATPRPRINHLIGLDIPFHRPAQPDLVLDAAREEPPEQGVLRIITAVPGLGGPIRNAAA